MILCVEGLIRTRNKRHTQAQMTLQAPAAHTLYWSRHAPAPTWMRQNMLHPMWRSTHENMHGPQHWLKERQLLRCHCPCRWRRVTGLVEGGPGHRKSRGACDKRAPLCRGPHGSRPRAEVTVLPCLAPGRRGVPGVHSTLPVSREKVPSSLLP
jgi:hypothetical protein